jgi:pimeloyl-ACP methyl ester carboxylesterase
MDLPGLLLLLLIGLAAGWALLTIHTAWMLTHPPRRSYAWAVARSLPGDPTELRIPGQPADHRISFESWSFRSRGLDLPVWDIRGLAPAGPTLILTHGWGDSRVTMLASGRIAALLPVVSRLLLWDLPGHGDAPGRCTMGAWEHTDLAALIDRLATDPTGHMPRPLVLYGFSLGAIAALNAAHSSAAVSAVIAESPPTAPWTPARNVLRLRALPYRSNLPPAMLLVGLTHGQSLHWWPRTDTLQGWAPASLRQPLLILHGLDDAITPVEDARRLAASIPSSRLIEVAGGRHTTLFSEPEQLAQTLPPLAAIIASLG